jgi:hypothetical protein
VKPFTDKDFTFNILLPGIVQLQYFFVTPVFSASINSKKNHMKNLLFIIAAGAAFASCKKATPAEETCTVNTTSIVGKYTITAISYKSSASATAMDVFASMNECQKDDTYDLKADGSVVIAEEANNCGTPPPPGTPSTWSLSSDNTRLSMGNIMEIQSFDCKKLIVVENNLAVDGDIQTTTYTKQ